ncbi:MAG: hypothetical protein WC781_00485 [Candidatus Pacearchaeota archaeon]
MNRTKIKETLKHLRSAHADELKMANFFVKAEEIAKRENMSSAAEFFRNAAKDEKRHAVEIEKVLEELIE